MGGVIGDECLTLSYLTAGISDLTGGGLTVPPLWVHHAPLASLRITAMWHFFGGEGMTLRNSKTQSLSWCRQTILFTEHGCRKQQSWTQLVSCLKFGKCVRADVSRVTDDPWHFAPLCKSMMAAFHGMKEFLKKKKSILALKCLYWADKVQIVMKCHRANFPPTLIHPCLKTCQAGEALIKPYRTRGSAVVLNVITGVTQARLQLV